MASRANLVDFSLPYTDSGVTMLVPIKHNMHRSMWVFLKPLSLDLWLTTIAASIATGIVLLILEQNARRESLQPLELLCLILWFPFSSLVLPESKLIFSFFYGNWIEFGDRSRRKNKKAEQSPFLFWFNRTNSDQYTL